MIEFDVEGLPSPQGSKTAMVVAGRARVIDKNPKALKAWRKAVEQAARAARAGGEGFGADEPIVTRMMFRLPRGATVKREHPTTVPDLDKLLRATNDALTTSGLIADDKQIVRSAEGKRYALPHETPGVRIRVFRLNEG